MLAFATPAQTISAGTPVGGDEPDARHQLRPPADDSHAAHRDVSARARRRVSSRRARQARGPAPCLSRSPRARARAPAFYYRDTRAGSHVLTASAFGVTSATQTMTVTPGPLAALTITPASATVRARSTQRLTAGGADAYGNAVPGVRRVVGAAGDPWHASHRARAARRRSPPGALSGEAASSRPSRPGRERSPRRPAFA